jgi:hypothetical protein
MVYYSSGKTVIPMAQFNPMEVSLMKLQYGLEND